MSENGRKFYRQVKRIDEAACRFRAFGLKDKTAIDCVAQEIVFVRQVFYALEQIVQTACDEAGEAADLLKREQMAEAAE